MKNIYELLGEYGFSVPEDKKAGFTTSFNENYKTVIEAEKLSKKITVYAFSVHGYDDFYLQIIFINFFLPRLRMSSSPISSLVKEVLISFTFSLFTLTPP